jgi:hypothetical protein
MKIAAVISRLSAGDHLHLGFAKGSRIWWFEGPYQIVPEHVVHAAVRDGTMAVVEAGDSLFGLPENSQTWLVEEAYGDAP